MSQIRPYNFSLLIQNYRQHPFREPKRNRARFDDRSKAYKHVYAEREFDEEEPGDEEAFMRRVWAVNTKVMGTESVQAGKDDLW